MLPKDIGLVIACTGMNRNDRVLDAGTGSGIAAIYFGGVAGKVVTYEIRPEFARQAEKNVADAKLSNVQVVCIGSYLHTTRSAPTIRESLLKAGIIVSFLSGIFGSTSFPYGEIVN